MPTLPPLITALLDPHRHGPPVERVQLVETHISWVLLTGPFAYKLKKPLDLGFLDFSTLEKRRVCCEEELRLNRRLAPQLYVEVVPITGSAENPRLGGPGSPIEYAVKMRQFDTSMELDRVLARGELSRAHIDELAAILAGFHERAAVAGADSDFGNPPRVYAPVEENFVQILARLKGPDPALARLRAWSDETFARLREPLATRKQQGFVRECHGDAHLANMVLFDGRVVLFDCLEFNANLRWIDVMSEVAFVTMDLDDRRRPDLSRRLLNRYLEHSGDYGGLAVHRFYQVYRALVRAKVAAIRRGQPDIGTEAAGAARADYQSYVALAERYTRPSRPVLIIAHGVSGAGKTWVTQRLLEAFDSVRVRSDIERKRLHGLAPLARSASGLDAGIYTAAASERTYARLAELAGSILRAGSSAIVDATFLKRAQRDQLHAVAEQHGAPFLILDVQAPDAVLRARLTARARAGRDASEADFSVVERQLASREPLGDDEQPASFRFLSVDDMTAVETQLAEFDRRLSRLQTGHGRPSPV